MKTAYKLICMSFALTLATCCMATAQMVSVTPKEDTEVVLHNPDMGWVLYENDPIDHRPDGSSTLTVLPKEDFAGVDTVALMFSWPDVEKRDGVYDFSDVDRAYDYWRARGKKIQLRLSTESLLWWNNLNPPSGTGVPDYVLQHLPADAKQTRQLEGLPYSVVDARDPYYLDRLEKFLSQIAAHFNHDRPVTLIDLRGFGVWGEWHSGFKYASTEDRRAALKAIIDVWSKSFPKHPLPLSYSYDPDGPKDLYAGPTNHFDAAFTKTYADFVHYSAFDHAMTKPNITFRRDGVGGAVHSNERKLCEEAFATLAKGPMMCEFLGGYRDSMRAGIAHVNFMLDDALSLHPNYINLLGWQSGDALAFLKEQPDLINRGLREMGYRLVPTRVSYPRSITSDQPMKIETTWANRAVGRAMRDFSFTLLLVDDQGKTIATSDAGPIASSKWIKGKSYDVLSEARFKNVPPGKFQLRIALTDSADGERIALPLTGGDKAKSYPIGEIDCEAAAPSTSKPIK